MNITLTYTELADLLAKELNIKPTFQRIDDRTLSVGYTPGLFIPPVTVQLHVDAMRRDIICLSYDCHAAVSLIIKGAVEHMRSKIPQGIEVNTEKKTINIYPLCIKELHKFTDYFTLSRVTFTDNAVVAIAQVYEPDNSAR